MTMLTLACITLGASIVAAFRYPSGWMILLAFVVGFACAWLLFGSLMAYGQQRAAAKLLKQKQALTALAAVIGKRSGAATPNTTEGTAQ